MHAFRGHVIHKLRSKKKSKRVCFKRKLCIIDLLDILYSPNICRHHINLCIQIVLNIISIVSLCTKYNTRIRNIINSDSHCDIKTKNAQAVMCQSLFETSRKNSTHYLLKHIRNIDLFGIDLSFLSNPFAYEAVRGVGCLFPKTKFYLLIDVPNIPPNSPRRSRI